MKFIAFIVIALMGFGMRFGEDLNPWLDAFFILFFAAGVAVQVNEKKDQE